MPTNQLSRLPERYLGAAAIFVAWTLLLPGVAAFVATALGNWRVGGVILAGGAFMQLPGIGAGLYWLLEPDRDSLERDIYAIAGANACFCLVVPLVAGIPPAAPPLTIWAVISLVQTFTAGFMGYRFARRTLEG